MPIRVATANKPDHLFKCHKAITKWEIILHCDWVTLQRTPDSLQTWPHWIKCEHTDNGNRHQAAKNKINENETKQTKSKTTIWNYHWIFPCYTAHEHLYSARDN